MTRGKKAHVTPNVQWSIMVPIDLAFRVETQLMDPVTNRPSYAARSKLIQSLLFDWLQRQGTPVDPPVDPAPPAPLDTSKDREQNSP